MKINICMCSIFFSLNDVLLVLHFIWRNISEGTFRKKLICFYFEDVEFDMQCRCIFGRFLLDSEKWGPKLKSGAPDVGRKVSTALNRILWLTE